MHQRHDTIRRRHHRRARWRGDIDTIMGIAWLAVVKSLAAIDTGDRTTGRPDKVGKKIAQVRITLSRRTHQGRFLANTGQCFRWRLHGFLWHTFDARESPLLWLDLQESGFPL